MRVAAAMSGGVDSSVAAALAAAEGHEVIGLTLKLLPSGRWETETGCCSAAAASDARAVAAHLGIKHYVLDAAEEFERDVVAPFAAGYARGETPNPCVWCNEKVKFGWFVRRAKEQGAEALVTGHYARTGKRADGTPTLLRAVDETKDQSYFLYRLDAESLAYARFPIGAFRKTEVREKARAMGLPVADKPDSQEICFVREDTGHMPLILERHPETVRAGEIVNAAGAVVGRHEGFAEFTVGQRRGLGVSAPERMYVLEVQPQANRVVVGPESSLGKRTLEIRDCRYPGGAAPAEAFHAQVRIRSMHIPAAARVFPLSGGTARIEFESPQKGVAPGQSAVLYMDELVVGGGVIASSR